MRKDTAAFYKNINKAKSIGRETLQNIRSFAPAASVEFAKKVVGAGSDYIVNRAMLQPGIDKAKGEMTDKKRTQVTRARESRVNNKRVGY